MPKYDLDVDSNILIRAKIVDLDANPNGPAIKVEVDPTPYNGKENKIYFWIHRLDQPFAVKELENYVPEELTKEEIDKRKNELGIVQ